MPRGGCFFPPPWLAPGQAHVRVFGAPAGAAVDKINKEQTSRGGVTLDENGQETVEWFKPFLSVFLVEFCSVYTKPEQIPDCVFARSSS